MNVKNNRRTKLTKKMLREAFLELLKVKPAERISVSELCAEADVNRSTFYAHYTGAEDLLRELEEEIISQFPIGYQESSEQKVARLFRYIMENREVLHLLLQRDVEFRGNMLETAIMPFRTETERKEEDPETAQAKLMHLDFIAAGSLYLIEKWVNGSYPFPADRLSHYIYLFSEIEEL